MTTLLSSGSVAGTLKEEHSYLVRFPPWLFPSFSSDRWDQSAKSLITENISSGTSTDAKAFVVVSGSAIPQPYPI